MSVKALHLILGDTPQGGFGRIGSSDAFSSDKLDLLAIQNDKSRVVSEIRGRAGYGFRRLAHVWEYQTGQYGRPVVINSVSVIGSGRVHAFSEYIVGDTDNIAEKADAGEMIRGADQLNILKIEAFVGIAKGEEVNCEEEQWEPKSEDDSAEWSPALDERWRLTLLSRYWQQASIRAFSENVPDTVHVNLGKFKEDTDEDTEETISQAKLFFSKIICKGLPKQVQNIASMAAGVNCEDITFLNTALEFDISQNMLWDDTLKVMHQKEIPDRYKLNDAEWEFIQIVASRREVPDAVQNAFDAFSRNQGEDKNELNIPFMADYRVWYNLYCMSRIAQDGHGFIEKAKLMEEHGKPNQNRDARACYRLIRETRRILEGEHRLKKEFVTEWLEPLEISMLKVMLNDMKADKKGSFLLSQTEIVDYFREYLDSESEEKRKLLIQLNVLDQKLSPKGPQFILCYPSVQIGNKEDHRCAEMMKSLLSEVIGPLIDKELDNNKKKHEEPEKYRLENKYLKRLGEEAFADQWVVGSEQEHTKEVKEAFAEFFQEQNAEYGKYFLLREISEKYLGKDQILQQLKKHFDDQLDQKIKDGNSGIVEWISRMNAVSKMDTLFNEKEIAVILKKVFDAAKKGERMKPSDAKTVFDITDWNTIGKDTTVDTKVLQSFTEMLSSRREESVNAGDLEGFDWQCKMLKSCPWKKDTKWLCQQKTANTILACDISTKNGKPLNQSTKATIQHWLEEKSVQREGISNLQKLCNYWLEKEDKEPAERYLPFFDKIDSQFVTLWNRVYNQVKENMGKKLKQPRSEIAFGELIRNCQKDTERVGKKLDDLYRDLLSEVEAYLKQRFASTADLGILIEEEGKIPKETEFYKAWESHLNDLVDNHQVDLFNRQDNLEKIKELRKSILQKKKVLYRPIDAAYQVIDEYGKCLDKLAGYSEYELISKMGQEMTKLKNQLEQASDVRKTLCGALRGESYSALKELKTRSFRHALCGMVFHAMLTDDAGENDQKNGCPDWNQVLEKMFSKADLEKATQNPFSEENIRILQRLLALVNTVKMMVEAEKGMNPDWLIELISTIHTNKDLYRYQNAIGQNKKMCEKYHLEVSSDGLVF